VLIEQAVILAAGRGTRLGPATARIPKPMLDVGGRPLIDRIIGSLAAAGIRKLVVVTGYLADRLENHLAGGSPLPIAFVRQAEPTGTAGAAGMARRFVGQEPFLMCWGDIATAPDHFAQVLSAWEPGGAGAVGVNEVADVRQLSAVVFDARRVITSIVEKPSGPPPSRWNSTGILALTSRIWPHIARLDPSPRGELEMTDAISSMIDAGERLVAVPLSGPWFDVGTFRDLEAARATFG